MQRKGGSFVPIVIAVAATIGFGAYVNRIRTSTGTSEYRPKEKWSKLEARLDEAGIEQPKKNGKPLFPTWQPSAAWIRFTVLADGKPNLKAGDLINVFVKDEEGRPWPVQPIRSAAGYFASVPATHPLKPRSLTFQVRRQDRTLGEWVIDKVADPIPLARPKLSAADLAKDHPGYEPKFSLEKSGDTGFSLLSLENQVLDDKTQVTEVALPFGRPGATAATLGARARSVMVNPTAFYEHFPWVRLTIRRQGETTQVRKSIAVTGIKIVEKGGKREAVLAPGTRYPIGEGATIQLTQSPHAHVPGFTMNLYSTAEGYSFSIIEATSPDLMAPIRPTGLNNFKVPAEGSAMSARIDLVIRRAEWETNQYWVPFDPRKASAR